MKLREVTEKDHLFVSILFQTAFDGRYQSRVLERLRADGDLALELVAEEPATGQTLGHISFARLQAPEGWWTLLPVAIIRDRQQSGIQDDIIRYGLDHARQAKAQAVVVGTENQFLTRFGFSAKAAENLLVPSTGASVLMFPVAPGTAGIEADLVFPQALADLRAVAE